MWPADLQEAEAVFIDVKFQCNTVQLSLSGSGTAFAVVSGGGLLVAGGGNGSRVQVDSCSFDDNIVQVVDDTTGGYASQCGGGFGLDGVCGVRSRLPVGGSGNGYKCHRHRQ